MNRITKSLSALAVGAAVVLSSQSAFAGYTKLGVLSCDMGPSEGKIISREQPMECFMTYADGKTESYAGSIGKVGITLGNTDATKMEWTVFQLKDKDFKDFPVSGDYYGVGADAALGAGIGANALVGGSDKAIGLQPVSVKVLTGLNVDLGVSGMHLEPLN